ncbi:dihydrolipoyllysine-residue acetyltransferase [Thermomonas sp.]|uniref:dihydrolipoyllysine-residue acetyltransferase n=1 Tax=Thermomonas sp. TaxID=1971895 RepID=UPI0035B0F9AF
MADLKEARVPDIGGHDDVPIIEVLVKVGDTVAVDQGLVTLESDKATMEVPSPFAGVIRELKVKLGDNLSEGALVAIIEVAAGAAAEAPAPVSAPTPPPAQPIAAVATATASETGAKVEPVVVMPPAPAPTPAAAPMGAGLPPVRFEADAVLPDKVPYASPAVRLFARELGVDLMQVTGSERGGRIGKLDVQNFVKSALAGGVAAAPSAVSAGGGGGLNLIPWPKVDFAKFGAIESKPLSRIQKISGANLARNWAMIPHVTQFDDADITDLEDLRVALNNENAKAIAAGKAGKVTMLAFMIKASVAALKKYPTFNASLDGDNLVLKQYYNIGFAADTPNGLVVPVLRDADKKGVMQIAAEMGELAAAARDGKLKPEQMQGGCFTISSLGGIGGTSFTPIINAPEAAILGVSKSETKPVWDGKAFQPRLIVPLSLSYDHRVIDGAAAARFTAYLAQLLADLRRAVL